MDWKDKINRQLDDQLSRCEKFTPLLELYQKHYNLSKKLKTENAELQNEVNTLKLEKQNLLVRMDQDYNSSFSSEKVSELQQKLFTLQEEVTSFHREKSNLAQESLSLTKQLQDKAKILQEQEAILHSKNDQIEQLKTEVKALKDRILELETSNKAVQDEHLSMQLAYSGLDEKYQELQIEHKKMEEQFARQSQMVADKLNKELSDFEDLKKRANQARIEQEAQKKQRTLSLPQEPNIPQATVLGFVNVPQKALHKFDAHDGEVHAVKWSPSGRMFATGGSDRKLKLWSAMAGKCESIATLTGSNQAITSIDFDLEEGFIVASSNDFACRIWSVDNRRLRHTLTGHSGKVLSSKFTCDNHIVTGSADRTLKMWDLKSKACYKTIFAGSSCHDLVIANSLGPMIISGHFDKKIRFWDPRGGMDNSVNEISLQGRVTSLDLNDENLLLARNVQELLGLQFVNFLSATEMRSGVESSQFEGSRWSAWIGSFSF